MLLRGLNKLNKFFYSNISLSFNPEKHAAYLTMTNVKKRNPLSLETIR